MIISIHILFGFLYEFRHLSENDIELACGRVKQEYRSDLEEEFTEEYKHFCHFVKLDVLLLDASSRIFCFLDFWSPVLFVAGSFVPQLF